ncbi:class I SAM-dependent RNA methyltransferase [Mycoplasma sp. 1012]
MITKIFFYNQKGEGVGLWNQKPVYLPFTILNETVEFTFIKEEKNYYIGKVTKIIIADKNRNLEIPKNADFIGGYELMHMNKEAEKEYKIYNLISVFKQIAKIDLNQYKINYFQGTKELRYRNKITLFDGGLKKKNSNEIFYLDDFLLTDIKPFSKQKGKIIIRKLETQIEGHKKDNIFTFDNFQNLRFKVSIGSFYQVNKEVALEAYSRIKNFIDQDAKVIDLYSGIGSIACFISDKVKTIEAVEINKNSYKDMLYNIDLNKINNIIPFNQDVYKYLKNLNSLEGKTIIVDPDRTGLKKEVINELQRLLPYKIIYLSCNIATQAYDISLLKDNYKIEYIEIFNMFSKTFHIENLIVLTKK